jgi:hypothetical protein
MKNLIFALIGAVLLDGAELRNPVPDSRPEASIDLMTVEGAALARAQWRYSDTKIIEVEFQGSRRGRTADRPSESDV